MRERVILIDENDREVGSAEKLSAHRSGQLHRAFSVFVFDTRKRLMLQRRAAAKYHSPGLWSNTCCGHPRPGETVMAAARRRLREEMGIGCSLKEVFSFTYRAELEHRLIEHELDHVLVGDHDGPADPNPDEVDAWRWCDVGELIDDLGSAPERYSAWLATALEGLRNRGLA